MASPLSAIAHLTGLIGVYAAALHLNDKHMDSIYRPTSNISSPLLDPILSNSDTRSLIPQPPAQFTITLRHDAVTSASPSDPAVQPLPSSWQSTWDTLPVLLDMSSAPSNGTSGILACIVVCLVMTVAVLARVIHYQRSQHYAAEEQIQRLLEGEEIWASLYADTLEAHQGTTTELRHMLDETLDTWAEQFSGAGKMAMSLASELCLAKSKEEAARKELCLAKSKEEAAREELCLAKSKEEAARKELRGGQERCFQELQDLRTQLSRANYDLKSAQSSARGAGAQLSTALQESKQQTKRAGGLQEAVDTIKKERDSLFEDLEKAKTLITTLENNDVDVQAKFYETTSQYRDKLEDANNKLWEMEESLEQEQKRAETAEKALDEVKRTSKALEAAKFEPQKLNMTTKDNELQHEKVKSRALQEQLDMALTEPQKHTQGDSSAEALLDTTDVKQNTEKTLEQQSENDCSTEELRSSTDSDEKSGEKQEPLDTKKTNQDKEKQASLKSSMWADQSPHVKGDGTAEVLRNTMEASKTAESVEKHPESPPSAPTKKICYYKPHTYDKHGKLLKTHPCKSGANCIGDPDWFLENGNAPWKDHPAGPFPYGGEGTDFKNRKNDENARRKLGIQDHPGLCSWCFTVRVPNHKRRIYFTEKEIHEKQQEFQARSQNGRRE